LPFGVSMKNTPGFLSAIECSSTHISNMCRLPINTKRK
jgi:hypothetical protein